VGNAKNGFRGGGTIRTLGEKGGIKEKDRVGQPEGRKRACHKYDKSREQPGARERRVVREK